MKNMTKTMMAASAIATVLGAIQVQAANGFAPGYADQDLLLSFRQSSGGTSGAYDYTIDLGNVSAFLSAHAADHYQITDSSLVVFSGGLNNVFWSAEAANYGGDNSLWLSTQRGSSTDNTVADSKAWQQQSSTRFGSAAASIYSLGIDAQAFGTAQSSSTIRIADDTDAQTGKSYHKFVTDSGNWGSPYIPGSTEGFTGPSFSGADRIDLYTVPAVNNGGSGTYDGYFELNSNGNLYYVGSSFVVPEPTAGALLSCFGLLALVLRRHTKPNA